MDLAMPWLLLAVAAGLAGAASLLLFLFECVHLLRDDLEASPLAAAASHESHDGQGPSWD
ncbi:MAG: hypothetical protein ACREPA_08455 [Candidatus Dormibacteraceae bacterium]